MIMGVSTGSVGLLLAMQGLLLGYALLDLAFDVDALKGHFEDQRRFYLTRDAHPSLNRMIVASPLPFLVLLTLWIAARHQTLKSFLQMLLVLTANGCGLKVVILRKELVQLSGVQGDAYHDQDILTSICYLHLAMVPLLIGAITSSLNLLENSTTHTSKVKDR